MDLMYCRIRPTAARGLAALACAALLATLVCGPAGAQSTALADADVFTVRDLPVDVTAANAAAAKSRALHEGQIAALEQVLRRLTRRVDHDALPRVDAGTAAFVTQDFEVANEKTSPVRYLADLTIRFKPAEVRRLLRQSGLPFAETASRPLLVLPVLKSPDGLFLWDASNAWRAAWSALPVRQGLVPLIVPFGDLTDIAEIDAGQAMLGDPEALSAITARYGAGEALVALATLSTHEDGLQVLDVAASRPNDTAAAPILLTFTASGDDDAAALMREAATETAARIDDSWLDKHLLRFDTQRSLTLAVPLRGLDDWIAIQRDLQAVAAISRVELRVLRRDSAEVGIDFFGDDGQLAEALARHDLELEDELPRIVVVGAASVVSQADTAGDAAPIRVLRRIE